MFGILRTFRKCRKVLRTIFCENVNWIKTILFNYRLLPIREAINLPIWLYGNVYIGSCTGKIQLLSKMRTGDISIGDGSWATDDHKCPCKTIIDIKGLLLLKRGVILRNGINIRVYGTMELGENVYIGDNCKILCKNQIRIGDRTRIAWESQIFDTNFHFVIKDDKYVRKIDSSVELGSHCWIGNRVTINKGTVLGDWIIVASNSLVNKDFGNQNAIVLAGMPVKIIAENSKRLFENEYLAEYTEIVSWFNNHPNEDTYEIKWLMDDIKK